MHRILSVAALSCAAFAAAQVAYATTPEPDVQAPYNGQRLFLISVEDRHGVLDCTPGRVLPEHVAACAALEQVGGNPAKLSGRANVYCTSDYHPVKVEARGVWDGNRYQYAQTFSNACELAVTTGPVFRL